jgi:hypothetical protein
MNIKLNRDMLRHGILLLTLGFILCELKSTREIHMLPFTPHASDYFSPVSGVVLIVISLAAVFVLLWIWRKYKLASFLKGWLKPVAYLIKLFVMLLLLFILWLISSISIPAWFFTALGILTLLISLAFVVAVFKERCALKLAHLLEDYQFQYWQIYWIVFTASWLKGLTSIPADGLIFTIAYWIAYPVGFAWFLVIPFIMLTATWQRRR